MKHGFTDDQIIDAKHAAAHNLSRDWMSRFNVTDIRAFLDALPEPQDDWQDVTDIRQIRRGDMLKNETENAVITYKYAVKRVDLSDGIIHFDNDELVFWHDNHTYYRIPAPVQHPDVDEHPVIGHIKFRNWEGETENARVGHANNSEYMLFSYGEYLESVQPQKITEWEPAEIKPKVVADDE